MITTINEFKLNEQHNEILTVDEIQGILDKHTPKQVIAKAKEYSIMGSRFIRIDLYMSEKTINNVQGQYPNHASLRYNLESGILEPQAFFMSGGNRLYRNIDPNNEKEKNYAMKGVKIPFRKPQPNRKAVTNAIIKFGQRYVDTLQDFKNMGLLRYVELGGDYSFLK